MNHAVGSRFFFFSFAHFCTPSGGFCVKTIFELEFIVMLTSANKSTRIAMVGHFYVLHRSVLQLNLFR